MSDVVSIEFLKKNNLILVDRDALLNYAAEYAVDHRIKWITRKEAIKDFKVSKYWLKNAETDPNSLLRVLKGEGLTSPVKYNRQSIIDELNRLTI
jgi:hypothetical protein